MTTPASATTRVRLPASVSVVGLALVMLVATGALPAAAVGVLGGTLTLRSRRQRARRRGEREIADLAAGLDVLVGELRVGASPVRAFEAAGSELTEATAAAFTEVAARARLGADVGAGLEWAGCGSSCRADWNRLAGYWRLAAEQGVAVAQLMHAAQRDLTARQQYSAQLGASLAGARATATILSALPIVGIGLGQAIGAEPLRFLLGSTAGGWCLLLGTTAACCGLVWADRITAQVTP